MANVADGAGLTTMAASGGLFVAFLVQDQQLAEDWLADGARVGEPLRGVAEREAVSRISYSACS